MSTLVYPLQVGLVRRIQQFGQELWRYIHKFPCLVLALGRRPNAPLIRFLISALYAVCLFILYDSPLILFYSLFPYLSPLLLTSFPLRIDPLCFQAGCRKRRLSLALVFVWLFCVVVHFFWLVNACFCCVRFSFFHTEARDWLGETPPKWPTLCRLGRKTITQSIGQVSLLRAIIKPWNMFESQSCNHTQYGGWLAASATPHWLLFALSEMATC